MAAVGVRGNWRLCPGCRRGVDAGAAGAPVEVVDLSYTCKVCWQGHPRTVSSRSAYQPSVMRHGHVPLTPRCVLQGWRGGNATEQLPH